jgi:hypothetical protein
MILGRSACIRGHLAPVIPEVRRRQLGVPHRVLDVLVIHPSLDRSGVVADVRERVAAPFRCAFGFGRPFFNARNPVLTNR